MLKVEELNALDPQEFTGVLARAFEHSPWVAARSASKRPVADRDELYAILCETVMKAGDDEKLSLIRAHPDLVGGELLTQESKAEQTSAGLGELSPQEIERFRDHNAQYREKFGFPFVICARLNRKQAMLDAFPIRLQNSRKQEIDTALREILKIAEFRLQEIVR